MKSINLSGMDIPPAIIELVPESIARENVLIPFAQENGVLRIAMRDLPDEATLFSKVQFIQTRKIEPVLASEEQIIAAIDRHYGPSTTGTASS